MPNFRIKNFILTVIWLVAAGYYHCRIFTIFQIENAYQYNVLPFLPLIIASLFNMLKLSGDKPAAADFTRGYRLNVFSFVWFCVLNINWLVEGLYMVVILFSSVTGIFMINTVKYLKSKQPK